MANKAGQWHALIDRFVWPTNTQSNKHPNVVDVLERHDESGSLLIYLVLELCDGTLSDFAPHIAKGQ